MKPGIDLYIKEKSVSFYDDRYSSGYMEKCPVEKKQKVFEVIKSLNLPKKGDAIDFGCGNGILTDVIRQALPEWTVYGTDISSVAIENARLRFPDCNFYHILDKKMSNKKFDLLFTHHVLEHVYDVDDTWREMNKLINPVSSMLHILPCGNEGSLEHSICLLRKDGINPKMGNRFFFEEEGHLRRLNTEQMCSMAERYGFKLKKNYYANQYYGAIKWIISESTDFIREFTDSSNVIDTLTVNRLKKLRNKLLFLHYTVKYGSVFLRKKSKKNKSIRDYILMLVGILSYLAFYPITSYINVKASEEWNNNKNQKNGSEMYLYYVRGL